MAIETPDRRPRPRQDLGLVVVMSPVLIIFNAFDSAVLIHLVDFLHSIKYVHCHSRYSQYVRRRQLPQKGDIFPLHHWKKSTWRIRA